MCLTISGDFLLCATFIVTVLLRECTGCPNADCAFHGLVNHLPSDHLLNFLLIFNIFALLCFLGLIQMVADKIIGNFASTWQKEGGKQLSVGETAILVSSSLRKTILCRVPSEPSTPEEQGSHPMDASSGNWWWWWWPSSDDAQSNDSNDEAIRSEKEDEALSRRILIIILSLANVTSSLLASMISYAIFANTMGPALALEFSHRCFKIIYSHSTS